MNHKSAPLLGLTALFLSYTAQASCGAAFCSVNSHWTSESAAVEAGDSFDLRYEYIKQDRLQSGSDEVSPGQIRRHHDEIRTINRNLLATYNRNFASGWGLSISAPLIDRDHQHVHNHHGEKIDERWQLSELGDLRVIGRYQLPNQDSPATAGINFGLKLPSGEFTAANADGNRAERSLQPGSGTTDGIVGAYYHQRLPSRTTAWFTQVQYQGALNTRQDFKPGDKATWDTGIRHSLSDALSAQLQLNLLWKGHDRGLEAEPADSGGRYAFLSPGLAYALSATTQIYGFVQLPLHQHVNGVQLIADRAFVAGISGRF